MVHLLSDLGRKYVHIQSLILNILELEDSWCLFYFFEAVCVCVEKGMYGNSVLPDQFYCELKTALKIKTIDKNCKLKG